MRYWPASLVTALRDFSIRAGLLASTVTPGRTPPVASFTVPAMAPAVVWAPAATGSRTSKAPRDLATRALIEFMASPLAIFTDGLIVSTVLHATMRRAYACQ